MHNPFFHGVGGVLSADIAVPDHARQLSFYTNVLTTGSAPLWRDDLTNNQGTPVIGLGERVPEYEALPMQWMPHFQVSDVAESAARALELGGQELMHGKGDDGQSQWAVLVDPNGAAFGVIPVVADESNGTSQPERVGCIAGLSLVVSEVSSLCDFYEQVIGWSASTATIKGCREMQGPDGVAAAEICQTSDDKVGIPSVWLLSLPVDDFEESLRQVRIHGGKVVVAKAEDKRAVIQDPIGVCFALQANK